MGGAIIYSCAGCIPVYRLGEYNLNRQWSIFEDAATPCGGGMWGMGVCKQTAVPLKGYNTDIVFYAGYKQCVVHCA